MCRISGFFEIRWLAAEIFSRFLLCSFDVRRDLLRVLFVIIGKNIAVGHTNRLNPVYACHLLLICEIGIAEFLKPGKVVEHGMINAVRTGGAHVRRWHAQVLKKDRVIGTAAQIAHGHIRLSLCRRQPAGIANRFRRRLRVFRAGLIAFSPVVVQHPAFGARHDLSHVA